MRGGAFDPLDGPSVQRRTYGCEHCPALRCPCDRGSEMGESRESAPSFEDLCMTKARKDAPTVQIGFVNKHGLTVTRATGLPGTDHLQKIYVLRCPVGGGHEFGANG